MCEAHEQPFKNEDDGDETSQKEARKGTVRSNDEEMRKTMYFVRTKTSTVAANTRLCQRGESASVKWPL